MRERIERERERELREQMYDLQYHGPMRLASAVACLDTATELAGSFEEIRTPFLCLAAEKDIAVVVSRWENTQENLGARRNNRPIPMLLSLSLSPS